MGKKFNPDKESSYLQYLDANNLYGWAMLQPLPTGGFRWVSIGMEHPASGDSNEVGELTEWISDLAKCNKGYLPEVDVSYSRELHDQHNDFSFMCERMKINGVEKLVPNLHHKQNYVIHIRALDQALKHGLTLGCIHRVIEFDQSAWMKPYIDFNTQFRTKATNDFEKDFFKLMNNAMFGKTMENI